MFNEIFKILKLNDNSEIAAINKGVFVAKPIPRIANDNKRNPAVSGMRLSYRDTSHPEKGKPISELSGMKSNTVPSSASLYPKVVLIVGIRDAQEEKQNPDRKKNKLRKTRCLFLRSMLLEFGCEYQTYH